MKIVPDAGSAFFLRLSYLKNLEQQKLISFYETGLNLLNPEQTLTLDEEETEDLLNAAETYLVELTAMNYVSRAEQCRFGLTQKLTVKLFNKHQIEAALDYLEEKNYLNDCRFASSWLRTRSINHAEGKIKLTAELLKRGIAKKDAEIALDEFFEENDESELCKKAYEKLLRLKTKPEKIFTSLESKGFTYQLIKNTVSECEKTEISE